MAHKSVGILSQNYRRNYGGILQSYALYQVISKMGYDVEIIDFSYEAMKNISFLQIIKMLKRKILSIFKKNEDNIKIPIRELPAEHINAFIQFKEKYQKLSPSLNNQQIGNYVSKYDAIVVGSDQVWNDIEGRHLYYFFDFGKPYYGKKIAYAPCSIITKVDKLTRYRLKRLFLNIDSLSVRDYTTQNLVKLSSDIIPQIVVDPTFLYNFNEFISTPLIHGDYIFSYILGSEIDCGHAVVLNKIFDKYGRMPVIAAIIPDDSLEVEKFADEVRYNASPADWVNLIANAKFVYTDSFHGCVFSMKFHKPFFAYYKDAKRSSRLLDLSKTYGLKNIQPSHGNIILYDNDYAKTDTIVAKQISESVDFLKNSLP